MHITLSNLNYSKCKQTNVIDCVFATVKPRYDSFFSLWLYNRTLKISGENNSSPSAAHPKCPIKCSQI